jgi:hypothetical protein
VASTAPPTLSPISNSSLVALPPTGSKSLVTGSLPFGVYTGADFISGAVDQVAYVYRKLGGEVLDIELTANQVYTAYEEAVLEYSYIVNIHQSKNALSDLLGQPTGTFDSDGELQAGTLNTALSGTGAELRLPKFNFAYGKRAAMGLSEKAGVGGDNRFYTASFETTQNQQEYNLQAVVSASAASGSVGFSDIDRNHKINITRVYYKSPRVMWRFYGYYGGINAVGNMSTYGQYADDSTWQVVPVWQNKLQAMAYEDAMYTRISHYSYELRDNWIRIYPAPGPYDFKRMWFEFTVEENPIIDKPGMETGTKGVNNMNTAPFANIPYNNINSIGKQWIRRFALSVSKEMLGLTRSKFATIPIPGENTTLNGPALIQSAKEEQIALRDELKTVLDELTYVQLTAKDSEIAANTETLLSKIPLAIYPG